MPTLPVQCHYLEVGHTHTDQDGLYGVFRRVLLNCQDVWTHEEMRQGWEHAFRKAGAAAGHTATPVNPCSVDIEAVHDWDSLITVCGACLIRNDY